MFFCEFLFYGTSYILATEFVGFIGYLVDCIVLYCNFHSTLL
jgi:hypothetical protein